MAADESRDIGTWIAVATLTLLGGLLLGLMAMVAPHLLGVVLVIGGFLGFGALHYLLWGWWMQKMLMKEPSSGDQPVTSRDEAR